MIFKRILHNWHVKVICLSISLMLVFFTRANALKEESVVVFLETRTNNRYTFTDSLPQRVTVTLKGEESEIKKVPVDSIKAYVDIRDIEVDGIYNIPIEIDQGDVFPATDRVEITVEPMFITSNIEEKVTKYLRVESIINGIPAHGYELTGRFINPDVISVSGPGRHMENLESINTEAVDLSGKNSNFTARVRLDRTDSLLSFPEGDFINFQGIIEETSVVKVIENVNIAIKNLQEGLEVITELPKITVHVEGKLLSLKEFTKNNVALTISFAEITEPGIYELPINYWTPRYAHLFDKSRDVVTVEVQKVETP